MSAIVFDMYLWELLAFCAIAFAAAPLEWRIGLRNGRSLRVGAIPAVAFGAAVWLGPAYAPLPAFFGVLGRMTFRGTGSARFPHIAAACVRLPLVALVSAWVYMRLGGDAISFPSAGSLPAMVAALAAFIAADRISLRLSNGSDSRCADMPGQGLAEFALAALLGVGLVAYRALLPAAALVPLPLVALVIYAVSLTLASRRGIVPAYKNTAEKPSTETISFIDHLTGLANECYVMMFLSQEISRATRSNSSIAVMMFDIDDFKAWNTEHSRDTGDRMLADIGALIRGMMREYDIVARYADDEFVIVVPDAQGRDDLNTTERIREAVAQHSPDWLKTGKPITVSAGLAHFPDHGVTPDDLINSALHALNRAKFAGKNQVVSCHDLAKKAA